MEKEWTVKIWGRVFIFPLWVKWLLWGITAILVIGVGLVIQKGRSKPAEVVILTTPQPSPTLVATAVPTPSPTPPPTYIWVYVVGQVKSPGVYEIPSGSMVSSAIEVAGGFSAAADQEAINLVSILKENVMIKVPTKGEENSGQWLIPGGSVSGEGGSGSGGSGSEATKEKVNINTADLAALCTLSGVGESTAKKIIAYREENGPFAAIEDIMNVPGIKEAKFASIKDEICVG